jgi:hypothetical protein
VKDPRERERERQTLPCLPTGVVLMHDLHFLFPSSAVRHAPVQNCGSAARDQGRRGEYIAGMGLAHCGLRGTTRAAALHARAQYYSICNARLQYTLYVYACTGYAAVNARPIDEVHIAARVERPVLIMITWELFIAEIARAVYVTSRRKNLQFAVRIISCEEKGRRRNPDTVQPSHRHQHRHRVIIIWNSVFRRHRSRYREREREEKGKLPALPFGSFSSIITYRVVSTQVSKGRTNRKKDQSQINGSVSERKRVRRVCDTNPDPMCRGRTDLPSPLSRTRTVCVCIPNRHVPFVYNEYPR